MHSCTLRAIRSFTSTLVGSCAASRPSSRQRHTRLGSTHATSRLRIAASPRVKEHHPTTDPIAASYYDSQLSPGRQRLHHSNSHQHPTQTPCFARPPQGRLTRPSVCFSSRTPRPNHKLTPNSKGDGREPHIRRLGRHPRGLRQGLGRSEWPQGGSVEHHQEARAQKCKCPAIRSRGPSLCSPKPTQD